MKTAAWLLVAMSLTLAAQSTPSQTASTQAVGLEEQLHGIVAHHHGGVAFYAENLKTHQSLSVDPERPVQTASVIKLAILFEAMEQVRTGRAQLSQTVRLRKSDQVNGSGVLQLFNAPATFTLHDILMLMITQSDNTATNLAIDTLGLESIDREIQQLGLTHTWLYKKISQPPAGPMPADQKLFGLGKTTPREMAALMAKIYTCSFTGAAKPGDDALCTDMLTLLQKQFYRDGIPRYLEQGDTSEQADAAIGNKSGALDAVRNDVGLVSTKAGPVILAIFTYNNADTGWYSDNEGEVTIARLSKAIINAWSPEGLGAEGYKPLSAVTSRER